MRLSLTYALALASLVSCKTSSGGASFSKGEDSVAPGALSMNDVSILFPNHQNPAFLARMPNLSEGYVPSWAGQELANNFKNRPTGDKTVDGRGHFQADLSPYKLAAIRIDPCPNDLQAKGNDKACIRQIRATWQIQTRELGPFAMDSNVHTAYFLTDTEFREVLTTLRSLHANASIDTTGMPLSVHPVIQKEGPESAYLTGVLQLLKTYAKPTNLMVMAGLRRAEFETWTMTTFSQNLETQTIQQNRLIGVVENPDNATNKIQIFAVNRQKSTSFMFATPPSSSPQNISAETVESVPKALAFENPKMHNPLTTDCSSCHQAAHISLHPELTKAPFDRTKSENLFTSSLDLTFTIPDARDKTALQMFSFSTGKPRITPRVVNETANVLEYLQANGL